jgi:polyferredoxin
MATGIINPIHPSGLVILLMALVTALLSKRGFCSWVCPFGLLTEYLNRLHSVIFRKKVNVPLWLDYPLLADQSLPVVFSITVVTLVMYQLLIQL